ncbi:MAG: sulfite exporter TauE/SafE family protein [Burkholderiaceae bacterium]|nr:sulfite exporter TauE/SafE family protein [Burkholderiaceae bacterium]
MGAGLLSLFALVVIATSIISGIFGMAGGMILMGVLVAMLPVSTAMVLHGATQMTANGWRAVMWRRNIDLGIFGRYLIGLALSACVFVFIGFVPDRAAVLLTLGAVPFLVLLIPASLVPQANTPYGAQLCGFLNASLQFTAGVSGPMLDVFFVRSQMDRRMVVATKAACQTISHLAKLIYFMNIMGTSPADIDSLTLAIGVIMAILGTSLSKLALDRLTDHQFRRWTRWLVLTVGSVYLVQGTILLL